MFRPTSELCSYSKQYRANQLAQLMFPEMQLFQMLQDMSV
jgi:hypothetical protein